MANESGWITDAYDKYADKTGDQIDQQGFNYWKNEWFDANPNATRAQFESAFESEVNRLGG